jgi:hypothetical protein
MMSNEARYMFLSVCFVTLSVTALLMGCLYYNIEYEKNKLTLEQQKLEILKDSRHNLVFKTDEKGLWLLVSPILELKK